MVQGKFNRSEWLVKDGRQYPYREKMINDIVYNRKLHGLKRNAVLNQLGEPTRSDTDYLFYRISQSYIGNLIPLHTKSLVIKFRSDSTVEWTKIHE